MRQAIVVGISAALVVYLDAARADAARDTINLPDPKALVEAAVGVVIVGIADIGFTLYDLPSIFTATPQSREYGTVELILCGTQLAVGLAQVSSTDSSNFWTGYTIWMGALTLHGIWSVAATPRAAPGGRAPDPPRDESDPSAQISIGPTYVPVGQLARPGFGLVGRF